MRVSEAKKLLKIELGDSIRVSDFALYNSCSGRIKLPKTCRNLPIVIPWCVRTLYGSHMMIMLLTESGSAFCIDDSGKGLEMTEFQFGGKKFPIKILKAPGEKYECVFNCVKETKRIICNGFRDI
jgi:hypothetical protein